jgi:hypothetical protein
MIAGWTAWARGRVLWLPVAAWLVALVLVYTQWWQYMGVPSPHADEYLITLLEIAPVMAGLVAIYGILPRMDWIDAQAVTHPQRRDLTAAAVLVGAFALIPPLVRWLFSLHPFYTVFVLPESSAADPANLGRALPYSIIWPYVVFIAGVLGFALLATGFLGRTCGPILGLLGYFAVLCVQGYRLAPALIPRVLDRTETGEFVMPPTGAIVPIATLIVGLAVFRLSESGVVRANGWFRGVRRPDARSRRPNGKRFA